MLFNNLTDDQIRSICREKLESLEYWLRRSIDDTLRPIYGPDYIDFQKPPGNYIFNKPTRENIKRRIEIEPLRYPRPIDATLLDDCIYIICHKELYDKHFKPMLQEAFPLGKEEVRFFLNRLGTPRNHLSHTNPISVRQAEQIICYSNDIIDSLKNHYIKQNMYEDYNVPTIIKYSDSFGNTFYRNQFNDGGSVMTINLKKELKCNLHLNDILTIEIEIDQSFKESEYTINWDINHRKNFYSNVKKIQYQIQVDDIGKNFLIECRVISNKKWHKHRNYDDLLWVSFDVLFPE